LIVVALVFTGNEYGFWLLGLHQGICVLKRLL